jgi:8-oxo-dGTP pyrophosphatase MutT (NUDIX family)
MDEVDFGSFLKPNRARFYLSAHLPPLALTTAAYILAFKNGKILLGRHHTRGWDIIGGHIDPGETIEAAAHREAKEEVEAYFDKLHFLGFEEIELQGPRPDNYKYPFPKSYQAIYIGDVETLGEFNPNRDEDTVERKWFRIEEAVRTVAWFQRRPEVIKAALAFREYNIQKSPDPFPEGGK